MSSMRTVTRARLRIVGRVEAWQVLLHRIIEAELARFVHLHYRRRGGENLGEGSHVEEGVLGHGFRLSQGAGRPVQARGPVHGLRRRDRRQSSRCGR